MDTNLLMQYIIGFSLALIPAMIWGVIFYKKSRDNKIMIALSFVAGIFSVVPLFLWKYLKEQNILARYLHLDLNLDINQYIQFFSANFSLLNFLKFIIITLIIGFLFFATTMLICFALSFVFRKQSVFTFKKILDKAWEEPFLFVSVGFLVAILVGLSGFSLGETIGWTILATFWSSVMVGFLEEFAKHLVVRFTNERYFKSIGSVIEFSIMVALGFAFFENIVYFVDKIWLSPCSVEDVQNNLCLFNVQSGTYQHNVGIILQPFVLRSLFSTLAHILFSGIFGYFYGLAYFATEEHKSDLLSKQHWWMSNLLNRFLHFRKTTIFHEQKITEGLLIAMFYHGFFNFILDRGITWLIIPNLLVGYLFLSYLLYKKENQVILKKSYSPDDPEFQEVLRNIDFLEKQEEFQKKIGPTPPLPQSPAKKKKKFTRNDPEFQEVLANINRLERHEEQTKRKG